MSRQSGFLIVANRFDDQKGASKWTGDSLKCESFITGSLSGEEKSFSSKIPIPCCRLFNEGMSNRFGQMLTNLSLSIPAAKQWMATRKKLAVVSFP